MFSVFKFSHANNVDRKLYVGNIPRDKDLTPTTLIEVLNGAIRKLVQSGSFAITSADAIIDNPVNGAWISPDGLYAFIELRNSKEAVKLALALNNVSIIGQKLKVGKPKFKKEEPKSKNNNDPETLNSSSIISL